MLLTKEQILGAPDRLFKVIHVALWGGDVRIGSMTAYDEAEMQSSREKNPLNLMALLVATCVIDENEERLFTMDDVVKLGKKNPKVLDMLFDECVELNRMSNAQVEEKKNTSLQTSLIFESASVLESSTPST